MNVERLFQVSVYGLVLLSSVMLSIAEGAVIPQGLTFPLCIAAFLFTERWKLLRLSNLWANVCGVLALLLAAFELASGSLFLKLLAGAHLLVYLTWIVLFQEKSARHYWWLCALSVLQVSVGAVLTSQQSYGMLLMGYLGWAVWTLSVFSLYQAQLQFQLVSASPDRSKVERSPDARSRAVSAGNRRPESSATSVLLANSSATSTLQHDPEERLVSPRFIASAVVTALLAAGVAISFFVFIPRMWIGRNPLSTELGAGSGQGSTLTGFTEEVRLGDIGEILESTERVLEIRIFDDQTDQELDVVDYASRLGYDEPLFRGAVLSQYSDGRWSAINRGPTGQRIVGTPQENWPPTVRQEIRIKPIGTRKLFTLMPIAACRLVEYDEPVVMDRVNSVLFEPEGFQQRRSQSEILYVAHSQLPDEPLQRASIPSPVPWRWIRRVFANYLHVPPEKLSRLISRSREIVLEDSPNGAMPDPEVRAQRLLTWLRDSGQFSYTLNASIQDASIDPIEDFLFNRKSGHCEYYASALTLMLRAVDVPARMVSGFKGGSRNGLTGAFEVEQRHAHAWVEAFLGGHWVVLDPTPSLERNDQISRIASDDSAIGDLRSFVTEFWSRYVVDMNFNRQRRELYEPLKQSLLGALQQFTSGQMRAGDLFRRFKAFLSSPRRWFSWQGGVVSFVGLLMIAGMVWLARRVRRLLRRWRKSRSDRPGDRSVTVPFYERFRELCAARGLVRRPSQTPREFAVDVVQKWNGELPEAGLGEVPRELVESFYQVRFGERPLSEERSREINRWLSRMEESLQPST